MHLAASIPNFLIQEQVSLGEGYVKQPFKVKEGYLELPTGPGLGVELDENLMADKIGHDWKNPESYDADDGSVTVESELYACRAQIDAVTEAMRQAPGYTATDQRILILSDTLDVVPTTDDEITVGGREWGVASVASDPAQSYWELRGTRR